ncbi:adenylosuccinate synthase [Acidovorax sp. LjRoot129]|uniref:adenylosuccinate synthase n=1 Tax=unclassified Acidovorax TaxID=2684926 RepID=UPI003ECFF431
MINKAPVKAPFKHAELCKLAVGWLKRPSSRGGHGCSVAIDECRTGWTGEVPDALGYRAAGTAGDGTVLVECKVTRADFLADKLKPHRQMGGVGNWRYYLAPEGLIAPEELPPKWGLVEVNARGHLKTLVGAYTGSDYKLQEERLAAMRHESDTAREFFLVVRMFDRVKDAEKFIDLGKERNRLAFRVNDLVNELRVAKNKSGDLLHQVHELTDELGRYRAAHGSLPALEAALSTRTLPRLRITEI